MGYLFLGLGIVCTVSMTFLTKKSSKISGGGFISSIFFTFLVAVIQIAVFICLNGFSMKFSLTYCLFAIAYGVIGGIVTVLTLKAYQLGKISTFLITNTLGVTLIPYLVGIIFLKEESTLVKWLGLLLMIIAFVLIQFKHNESGQKNNFLFFLICVSCAVLGGLAQTIIKVSQVVSSAQDNFSFNILTQITLFVITGIIGIAARDKVKITIQNNKSIVGWKNILYISLYAVICGLGLYLSMLAAKVLPASVQFPLQSSLILVLTTVMAAIFFKEKMTLKDFIGVFLIICAVIMMSVL